MLHRALTFLIAIFGILTVACGSGAPEAVTAGSPESVGTRISPINEFLEEVLIPETEVAVRIITCMAGRGHAGFSVADYQSELDQGRNTESASRPSFGSASDPFFDAAEVISAAESNVMQMNGLPLSPVQEDLFVSDSSGKSCSEIVSAEVERVDAEFFNLFGNRLDRLESDFWSDPTVIDFFRDGSECLARAGVFAASPMTIIAQLSHARNTVSAGLEIAVPHSTSLQFQDYIDPLTLDETLVELVPPLDEAVIQALLDEAQLAEKEVVAEVESCGWSLDRTLPEELLDLRDEYEARLLDEMQQEQQVVRLTSESVKAEEAGQ